MTTITEPKQVYESFKVLKGIALEIKFASSVYLAGELGKENIKILFPKESEFFIASGEIYENSEFFHWLHGKLVKASVKDLDILGKVLKKNAVSLNYNENEFSFTFLDKESGDENKITFYNLPKSEVSELNSNVELFERKVKYTELLDPSIFENEITIIYEKDNKIVKSDNASEKLLELPTDRLFAIVKNPHEYSISFSEAESSGMREKYIKITTKNEIISLSQYFVTI